MTEIPGQAHVHGEQLDKQRSALTGTLVSMTGWIVVIIPIVLMAIIIFAEIMRPDQGMWAPRNLALMFAGALLLFCMIAFPHLLGQAVRFRERAMWRAAIITGVPTLGAVIYLIIRWASNLG